MFALLLLEITPEAGARFLQGAHGGGIGAEFDSDRFEAEAEAAIAQLVLQQIEGFTAPTEAAEHTHRFAAVALCQHCAQG